MDSQDSPQYYAVTAQYIQQTIPQYRENKLIEALPRTLNSDEWCQILLKMPPFAPEQRNWPEDQRLTMLASLLSFSVPLDRHVRLAHAVDSILREGYVGRSPHTAHHAAILQQLYEAKQAGQILHPDGNDEQDFGQRSSSFIGCSGIGKTSSLRKILERYPRVIRHPDLAGVVQIPWLYIEAPADGMSVKELALAIRSQIHDLVPDIAPIKDFSTRAYQSEAALMNHAARMMHLGHVGLLVVDEIHRLKFQGQGKHKLLNLLVAASNALGIPVLFVGTSKALKLLGLDFSSGRRSVGSGFVPWNVLQTSSNLDSKKRGEWEHFITAFWDMQWLNEFTPLTQDLSNLMFTYSQGIVDIALKLFIAVQQDAIFNRTETITAQGIKDTWERHFILIQPMIAALETGDLQALQQYEDIAPITFDSLSADLRSRYHGPRNPLASLRPGDAKFAPAIAAELMNQGVNTVHAINLAKQVDAQGKARNVREGVRAASVGQSRAVKKVKSESETTKTSNLPPGDYRNAILAAKAEGCSVYSKLVEMGAVFDFAAVLAED
ncbi:TniB protein [Paraburkholderia caribensis]|uniref:ATP-binding protein n=1 Tax=Paraburkholderia caribensis TaxID=75105 RepID=UPI001CB2A868|nr:ATP-binding protein [Paraburkholderia caribensis]CAG9219228.1 TniB protein [Paraburkholderia caribensis]